MKARNMSEAKMLGHDSLFLLTSLEKTNQLLKLKELINNTDVKKMKGKYGKKIVAYYKLKYSSDLSNSKDIVELENYIIDLKPILDIYGSLHKNVFDEEEEYI